MAAKSPATTIALDAVYSAPNSERDDVIRAVPGQSAAAILDKYIAALGGAQRLAGLTSYIATGKSVGYEGLGGEGEFTIYAKSPNQKTTEISYKDHPERGNSTWAFDGRTGWIKTPRGLLGEYEVSGDGLDGTRFDAQMAFPGQIKTLFTNWQRRSDGKPWRSGLQRCSGRHRQRPARNAVLRHQDEPPWAE